ncbi:MAG: flagellar filament capping protein FliD [Proteobacteria bacterium]|nr:flagellar filament capping protein FliD [Pseudomonadota bacterium]
MPSISFSGLASGIDSDAIIKTVTDQQRLLQKPYSNKIKDLETENKAFDEFNTKLLSLNDQLSNFLSLTGSTLAKKVSVSNEEAISASANNNTTASSTTINVIQLAKAGSLTFGDSFTAVDTPIAGDLTAETTVNFKIGIGANQSTAAITIDNTTTLSQLAEKINTVDNGGKIRATVVNLGTADSPQYKLLVNSQKTGSEKGELSFENSSELENLGKLQVGSNVSAQDAIIEIEGLGSINRATNQISDVVPGITLDLKKSGSGPVVVSVNNDADKSAQKFGDVITALNEIIKYSGDNNKIERIDDQSGVTNKFGSLAHTRIDDDLIITIRNAMRSTNSEFDGSKVRIFADLGVTTERDGSLKFDTEKFMTAIADDPAAVDKIITTFADKVSSTNGIVNQYTKFQGILESGKKSNEDQISKMNDKIAYMEGLIQKQSDSLKLLYSKLESNISKLNSEGQAISSLFNFGNSN